MPDTCLVCRRTGEKNVSMHRFPPKSNPTKREQWLTTFKLEEHQVLDYHRVCSRHFPNGDVSQPPSLTLGKSFASPMKMSTPRGERAVKRRKLCSQPFIVAKCRNPSVSREETPVSSSEDSLNTSQQFSSPAPCSTVSSSDIFSDSSSMSSSVSNRQSDTSVIINTALVARIEVLEAENKAMKKEMSVQRAKYFRLEDIKENDKLIRFYTGFDSYETLLAFFEFLGDAVNKLNYWGTKPSKGKRRKMKLDPFNQLFMTLIKLRLNTLERDLSIRFGISIAVVSKYFITWVNFLYCHLCEIQWLPDVTQVKSTLPHSFKDKYPNTYIILDATEIFIETPNDLHAQSSTWSNYKHHNTAKFLVGCTPNGAISFISPLYVGSISDVELTKVSGLIEQLKGKANISVMADRGFTIRDQLRPINVELNIPPFIDGRGQLPASEVLEGRKIASVRIHVERAINRIKNFSILKGSLPLTLVRMANQIVCVCCWLVNFQPVLVSPPTSESVEEKTEAEVDEYLKSFYSSESDSDESIESDI